MENIEKIKNMSVDELAEFLHGLTHSLAVKLNGEYVINETEQIKEWLMVILKKFFQWQTE